jgi:hypothetical protein
MAQGRPGRDAVKRSPRKPAPHGDPVAHGWHEDRHDPAAARSRKPRKGLLRDVFEEAFDVLDDIFD